MYPQGQPHPQQPGYPGPAPGPYGGGYGHPPMAYGGYQHPYVPTSPTVYGGVELASWGRRAGGYLIDVVVVALLITTWGAVTLTAAIAITNALEDSGAQDDTFAAVFIPLILLFYAGVFAIGFCYRWLPHARSGQTLGKRAVGIRLVRETTGHPVGKGVSAGRELIYIALGFVTCVGPLVDLLWPLWDDRNQTLHDKAVGGIVIVDRARADT